MVQQADSTLTAIKKKIRRLTASPSESSLSTADLEQAINTYYNQDFPYSIKIDQMRSVYTFFTEPYRDRYPLDVNFNQSVRAPVYFEGIQGTLFKDRQQFYNVWPRFPTPFKPISGDGNTKIFAFSVPGPFLSREVVLGGVDSGGNPITVNDDGNGNLLLQVPNPVLTLPPYTDPVFNAPPPPLNVPIPGMHNQNTANPGLNYTGTQTGTFTAAIGTVNYVTGAFNIEFPVAPAAGTQVQLWVSQYQTGRPYSLLYWNNEFTVRPVPKLVHKIEVETFLTPVQFLSNTDVPILNQWWQLLAYGTAMEILRDRQDFEGVENLREGFMRQEGLVLERQACEEIFQPNVQLFNQSSSSFGGVNGIGYY